MLCDGEIRESESVIASAQRHIVQSKSIRGKLDRENHLTNRNSFHAHNWLLWEAPLDSKSPADSDDVCEEETFFDLNIPPQDWEEHFNFILDAD